MVAYHNCCILSPIDNTKHNLCWGSWRSRPLILPPTAIANSSDPCKTMMMDANYWCVAAPSVVLSSNGHPPTNDSAHGINIIPASSSAIDDALQPWHLLVIRRLSDGNTVTNRGRERLVWWRPSTTNWRSWRPTQPHPVVHMGVHGHRAALVGVHPPLSPPIGRRCSPWWLLVDRVKGAVPIFLIKNK